MKTLLDFWFEPHPWMDGQWHPLKAEIPFGGIKQSGIGAEGGEEGIREFLETQVISMPKPVIAS